jgi:hypothetical protein
MDQVVCLESTDGGTQTSALGADRFRQLEPRQKLALTVTPKRTTHERSIWRSSCVRIDEVGSEEPSSVARLRHASAPRLVLRSTLLRIRGHGCAPLGNTFGFGAWASLFVRVVFASLELHMQHANCTCEQVEMDDWHAKNRVRAPTRERVNGSESPRPYPS